MSSHCAKLLRLQNDKCRRPSPRLGPLRGPSPQGDGAARYAPAPCGRGSARAVTAPKRVTTKHFCFHPVRTISASARPTSAVPACPPMSRVRGPPSRSSVSIARTIAARRRRLAQVLQHHAPPTTPGRSGCRCRARRCPAPSRAPARTCEGCGRSGLMFADGAMPIDPATAGPRSDEDVAEQVATPPPRRTSPGAGRNARTGCRCGTAPSSRPGSSAPSARTARPSTAW